VVCDNEDGDFFKYNFCMLKAGRTFLHIHKKNKNMFTSPK